MVTGKPVALFVEGISLQGEHRGISFPAAAGVRSEAGSLGDRRSPTALRGTGGVLCIRCPPSDPPSLILRLGIESRGGFHLCHFFLTLQRKTQLFLEITHFLALHSWKTQTDWPQPVLFLRLSFCGRLYLPFFFFSLAKFCFYEVVCRHRKGNLAIHEVTLSVILCSSLQPMPKASSWRCKLRVMLKFGSCELSRQGVTGLYQL